MLNGNNNLNLYKDFYAVSKYGSLSKAAEATYTSSPAISKSIKKLEYELNRTLFYRTSTGMKLTNYGTKLLYFVEKAFNSLIIAERTMEEEDNLTKGKLIIGMPSNIGSFFLFDKIIEFHSKYKNIEISIITGSTSQLIKLLQNHEVDFVIDTSPIIIDNNKELVIKKLDEVKYCFIQSINSNLKINSIKDLISNQLILPIENTTNRNDLNLIFKKYNMCDLNTLNLHTSEMIISAVKRDLGIGYVIEDLVKKDSDIKVIDIKEQLPTATINIIYNKSYLTVIPKYFINEYIMSINF